MPVAPSWQDLLDQGRAEAIARRADLLFADGDITTAQLHGAAAMADAVLRYGVQAFRETFLDGATGDALSVLVDDHLGIQRQPASAAEVTVEFTRTSAGGAGSIPAGTVIATAYDANGDQVRFTTDVDVAVGAGLNGPFAVVATAELVGAGGNVVAATVTRILDVLFDATFSVTNPAAAGGGNEAETDEELRRRARAFWLTLRAGTLDALEYGALLVPTVRVATATEDVTTGIASVLVTDADGNSTAQMIADVAAELDNWRAATVVVNVVGGVVLPTDLVVTLHVRAGVDAVALAGLVSDAIESHMRRLKVGETSYEDQRTAVVLAVDPDGITHVDFAPAGDIVPAANEVIRPGVLTVS